MILFTPIDLPKIQISDWDAWWNIWIKNSQLMIKVVSTHNSQGPTYPWKGLDLYARENHNHDIYTVPTAPHCNVVKYIIDQIIELVPINVTLIRVIENMHPIAFHSDSLIPTAEMRILLWNTYSMPIWKFQFDQKIKEVTFPDSTNTFWYRDCPLQHSAIYDSAYTKGLVQIFGTPKDSYMPLVNASAKKFSKYAWVL